MPLALLLLAGCIGHSNDMDLGCEPVLHDVAPDDTSLGFSAQEVVAFLADRTPVEVTWDDATLGDPTADIELEIVLAGVPAVAEPVEPVDLCFEPEPWLHLPVRLSIRMAGGEVVAEGDTWLNAGALDTSRVGVGGVGWDLPATLSGSYAASFEAWTAVEYEGYEIEGTWVTFADTWAEPVVDIDFQAHDEDSSLAAMAWRGTWWIPSADTAE